MRRGLARRRAWGRDDARRGRSRLFTESTRKAIWRASSTRENRRGATIDMALFDPQLAMLDKQASNAWVTHGPGRRGRGIQISCPISRSRGRIKRSYRGGTTGS